MFDTMRIHRKFHTSAKPYSNVESYDVGLCVLQFALIAEARSGCSSSDRTIHYRKASSKCYFSILLNTFNRIKSWDSGRDFCRAIIAERPRARTRKNKSILDLRSQQLPRAVSSKVSRSSNWPEIALPED